MKTVTSRILKGAGANAFANAVTIILQLLTVPIFLAAVGRTGFGEWVLISAIPAYLSLSDLGFVNVASNRMIMSSAKGDMEDALRVYDSATLFIASAITLIFTLSLLVIAVTYYANGFTFKTIPAESAVLILIFLIGEVLLVIYSGIYDASFKVSGLYAFSVMLSNVVRLVEWSAAFVVVFLSHSLVLAAGALFVGRLTGVATQHFVHQRFNPAFRPGFRRADWTIVRTLIRPAVAFMAFPLGNAFTLQGSTLVVGYVLGPGAVALFTTCRTLTRVLVQGATLVNRAVWPELSRAFGAGDMRLARELHVRSERLTFLISAAACIAVYLFGHLIFSAWTHGHITYDAQLMNLLLVVAMLNSMWQSSWVVILATNRHAKLALVFVITAAGSLVATFGLLTILRMPGVAYGLMSFEIVMLLFAVPTALALLQEKFGTYVRSLIKLG